MLRRAVLSVLLALTSVTPLANAAQPIAPVGGGITRLEITSTESPTFDGRSFGNVGEYVKLAGRAYGEVDPNDPRNAVITDLNLAPRNGSGMVEYATDVFILKPLDPSRGNHRLFFDVNNRGDMRALSSMDNAASGANAPTAAADAGNGYLLEQGYTIVSAGWDATVRPGNGRLTISVPVAKNPDGSTITGPALEELVVDDTTTMSLPLTYAAVSADKTTANLTVRVRYEDPPVAVPADGWVFAVLRDVATFLHRGTFDNQGNPNPVAGDVQSVYTFCVSQPCRTMHDFLWLGFNQDEAGLRVFDGILNWIGGGDGIFMNYRFAQPGRTHRQHIARWYPEYQFPFANQVMFDPISGKTDGRLRRCTDTNTCPQIFEVNSENEYWAKAMSVFQLDAEGNDLADAPNVRNFLMSSLPHAAGA